MASTAPPDPLPPDRNIGPMLVGVSIAFLIPTAITTALRLWTRLRERTIGADDYTIVFAMALTIVLSALSIAAVRHGKGRHVWYLSDEQQATISMLSWANQIVLFCAICMIKTSICLLILRIKMTTWLCWTVYTTIALLVITAVLPIIALFVECKPISGFWNRKGEGVTCTAPDLRIYSIYVQSAYSVLTDFTCSVLPVFIVWQLQVSMKKFGVCLLMSMGLVCTAFAGLRAASLSTDISDTSWTYTYTGTWMTIECNLGILAANLAPLRVLIVRVFPGLKTQYSHNRHDCGGIRMSSHHATARASRPARQSQSMIPSRAPEMDERWPRKTPSVGNDQSKLPLHDVLKTRKVRVEYTEAQSSSDVGDEIERRPWDKS